MGNRILKESICMSPEINALTWFEEVLFYRLIVTADDYGVCPGDPVVLSHILFPRKENIGKKAITDALASLERNSLIRRYRVPGKGCFLLLCTWSAHQRLRHTQRKYPGPEMAEGEEAAEDSPEQRPAGSMAIKAAAAGTSGEAGPAENAEKQEAPGPEPAVITIPLNDGSEFAVTRQDVQEYTSLYPAVDILQELRAMRGWCLGNEKKRKTRSGVGRFVNSWLARAQDRGGNAAFTDRRIPPQAVNPYHLMNCEGEVV